MKSLFKLKPKTPSDLVRQTRDLLVSLDLSGTEGKESRRGEKMMDLSELIRELKQVLYGNCESEPVAEACAQLTSEFFRKLAQMACLINNNMGVLSSDGLPHLTLIVSILFLIPTIFLEETVSNEKIWQLILQNEPSVIPISLASKLPADDLLACIYLVEVLIVDYPQRLLEIFPTKEFLQLMLFLLCHPNWITRKSAHDTMKKILVVSPLLCDATVFEFSSYISVVEEKATFLRMRLNSTVIHSPFALFDHLCLVFYSPG